MLLASCHCGDVMLEISRRPRSLTECNCSICRRYGALWAYYSRRSVRTGAGSKAPKIYGWGNRTLEYGFCGRCGCVMFHERSRKKGDDTRIAVNARMMDPGDVAGLKVRLLDGAKTWKTVGQRRLPF